MILDDVLKTVGFSMFDYENKVADNNIIQKYVKYYDGRVIQEGDEVMLLECLIKAFDKKLIDSNKFISQHEEINKFKSFLSDMESIVPIAVKKSEVATFKKIIDEVVKVKGKKLVKLKYTGEQIRCFAFEKALKDKIENTRYGGGSYSLDFKFMDVHYHFKSNVPDSFEDFIKPLLEEFGTFFVRDEKKIPSDIPTDNEGEISQFQSVFIYTFPLREDKSEYLAQYKEMYNTKPKVPKTFEEIGNYISEIKQNNSIKQNIKERALWVLEEDIDFQKLDELLLSNQLVLNREENDLVENLIYWKKGFLSDKDLNIPIKNNKLNGK